MASKKTKEMWNGAKSFFLKCKRVWHTLKKPSKEEFLQVTKVSAIGIAIVGAIGFIIKVFMTLLDF